ncbi:unnamed protein product, partial [marine sediment metagenome]
AVAAHDAVINAITAANFASICHTGLSANFDSDDLADIRGTLKTAKYRLDQTNIVLQPDYYTALSKDNGISDFSASHDDVMSTGILHNKSGMGLVEDESLPPSGGTPETENLVGFAATKAAMMIAMRAPVSQDPDDFIFYRTMTDPDTNIVMVYSAWHKRQTRVVYRAFEALLGIGVGNTEALQRIRSAA